MNCKNFTDVTVTDKKITAVAKKGTRIALVAEEAIQLSQKHSLTVWFTFNGIQIIVGWHDTVDEAVSYYNAMFRVQPSLSIR